MALLEVENLKIYYFTRAGAMKAVDDISFSVDKDETRGAIITTLLFCGRG
jgi:ABC-type dipeptide/oligopeptide/nickel transport system ATPase component